MPNKHQLLCVSRGAFITQSKIQMQCAKIGIQTIINFKASIQMPMSKKCGGARSVTSWPLVVSGRMMHLFHPASINVTCNTIEKAFWYGSANKTSWFRCSRIQVYFVYGIG